MIIRAAIARKAKQNYVIETIELEDPRDDEVLVELKGVGMCHTDTISKDFDIPPELPVVFGHEGAGIVRKVGKHVTSPQVGDCVIITFSSCGECRHCSEGTPGYCEDFFTLNQKACRRDGSTSLNDGTTSIGSHFFGQSSFATHATVYAKNCIIVDPDLPIEKLGPLACGVQTGAGTVMVALDVQPGSSVIIIGGGSVGLSALLASVLRGCDTIAIVDILENRRNLALELGATHVLNPLSDDYTQQLNEICRKGFDFAIDCTAYPAAIETVMPHLAIRGTIALLGFPPSKQTTAEFSLLQIMKNGQKVVGIIEGDVVPQTFIPELLSLYKAGLFPFDKLITEYRFEDINKAELDQRLGNCVKPVLIMDGSP